MLCATSHKALCCDNAVGTASWKRLKQLLLKYDLESLSRPEGIVLRSKVDCLRICNSGPILLVWPDGIWYGEVDEKRMDLIVSQHIVGGTPINEWIIKRVTQF